MAGTRIIEQWWPDRGLEELGRNIGEWYQALRFGPIPGAYLSIQLSEKQPVEVGIQRLTVLPVPPAGEGTFEMRPIFFGVFSSSDLGTSVTGNVDIPNFIGANLLAADFTLGPSGLFQTNKREDFAVDKVIVPQSATFASLALDFSAVTNPDNIFGVDAHVIFKEVSQVEP